MVTKSFDNNIEIYRISSFWSTNQQLSWNMLIYGVSGKAKNIQLHEYKNRNKFQKIPAECICDSACAMGTIVLLQALHR